MVSYIQYIPSRNDKDLIYKICKNLGMKKMNRNSYKFIIILPQLFLSFVPFSCQEDVATGNGKS